jgi:branched-chain amino acid aminotransferase
MNFFAVINGELHTPKLTGTILEGITRDSILTLARNREIKVVERSMDISELLEDIKTGKCSEAFVCGTASIVAPIYAFYEEDGTSYEIQNAKYEIAIGLREDLLNIQAGLEEAPFEDWIYNVDI